MSGTFGRDTLWNQQIWSDIDKAVRDEVGRIRVAQKVFPCIVLASGQSVPKDEVVRVKKTLTIGEGNANSFVEIWVQFSLTQSQVDSEDNRRIARTLATMAANKIALAEDAYLFQGKDGAKNCLPEGVNNFIETRNAGSLGTGLLGKAPAFHRPISAANPEDIVRGVVDGIGELRKNAQAGPYALFLPSAKFATASAPMKRTLVTPADRIFPLVTGGVHDTGSLPDNVGLLVSLGGEPTTIYMGIDATTAFAQAELDGTYRFRVFERIQFVARDQSALIRLAFEDKARP
jgi:uncharacterized linocin/CFP29 family protein